MFEVKARTVYADLKELKERAGLTIHFSRSFNGYFIEDPSARLLAFDLSEAEVVALIAAAHSLSAAAGSAYEQVLRSAIDKIVDRLPDQMRERVVRERGVITFHSDRTGLWSWSVFLDLVTAATTRKKVELHLSASSKLHSPIVVEPNLLVCTNDLWQLRTGGPAGMEHESIPLIEIKQCKILSDMHP